MKSDTYKHLSYLLLSFLISLLILAVIEIPGVALAAGTISVTSNAQGSNASACTLVDAITAANTGATTGGCTPSGTAPYTISLIAPDPYIFNTGHIAGSALTTFAFPDITADMTIDGKGKTIQWDSTGGVTGGFFYLPGTNTLTLNNVTIANSYKTSAVYAAQSNSTIIVNNSTFKNNGAGSTYTDFFGSLGELVGSAIYSLGNVIVNNSTFDGNQGPNGGAILGFTVTVTDSLFTNNIAFQQGGAIELLPPGSSAVIKGSSFIGNSANAGGAIGMDEPELHSLTVDKSPNKPSIFQDNKAVYNGGAIELVGQVSDSISNTLFKGNSTGKISPLSPYNPPFLGGGALYIIQATNTNFTQLNNLIFDSNEDVIPGAGGGAIGCGTVTGGNGLIDYENSTFTNNKATGTGSNGGAVNFVDCNLRSGNNTYTGNSADNNGGAIYATTSVANLSILLLAGQTFKNNSALHGQGGAFYSIGYNTLDNQATWAMTFDGNSAGTGGGAMYLSGTSGSSAKIPFSSFLNNTTATGEGGAILLEGQMSLDFTAPPLKTFSLFQNNKILGGNGGGSAISSTSTGTITVDKATFSGNVSSALDGAAFKTTAGTSNLSVSTFTTSSGGINIGGTGTATLTNLTVAGNNGSGINHSGSGTVTMVNDLVANNTTDVTGNFTSQGSNLIKSPGGSAGSFQGPGDILNQDPGTLGTLGDNGGTNVFSITIPTIALPFASPAIDKGNTAKCPGTDERGYYYINECDIGAYEWDNNDQWATAITAKPVDPGTGIATATIKQVMRNPDGSKWYKFDAPANSIIYVYLTGTAPSNPALSYDPNNPGLPANYDLSLHNNVKTLYDQLATPDPVQVASKTLPYGLLPYGLLPYGLLPYGLLPYGLLPYGLLPYGLLPYGLLPYGLLPYGLLPYGLLPQGVQNTTTVTPEFLNRQFLNTETLPQGSNLISQPYSEAIPASLLAVSAQDGKAPEFLSRNTWNNGGTYYVRVKSRDGAQDLDYPYAVNITVVSGACLGVTGVNPALTNPTPATADVGTHKTILLTDTSTLKGVNGPLTAQEKQDYLAKLNELANFKRTVNGQVEYSVDGVVVDLGEKLPDNTFKYKRIDGPGSANDIASQNVSCPFAKNLVANEIKSIVDAYDGTTHSIQNVVIAGPDNVIPFFRYPDQAGAGSEKEFFPPVSTSSSSNAALRSNLFFGQDAYGSSVVYNNNDLKVALPKKAVGRLVNSAPEIMNMVQAYLDTQGIITPQNSLVTGYDLVSDVATAVQGEVQSGIQNCQNCVTSLIQPGTDKSTDPTAWTANDLRSKLLNTRNDLVFLAGHFDQSHAEAADYSSLEAAELGATNVNLRNTLLLSVGCHAGFDIPSADVAATSVNRPDWSEVFATKGMTAVINTGFGYADTVLIDYSERLYLDFMQQLRTGTAGANGLTTVSVGDALALAKQRYLGETSQVDGMHAKVTEEATLYGLPMMQVRLLPRTDAGDGPDLTPVAAGGYNNNLSKATISVASTLQNVLVTLNNGANINTFYLKGTDGVTANQHLPILPVERRNVTASTGATLRGVGFWAGNYTETQNYVPVTSEPFTELGQALTSFSSDNFFPAQSWNVNYLSALNGGKTRLAAIMAQYKSNAIDLNTGKLPNNGTFRQFSNMDFNLYYSSDTTPQSTAPAPRIFDVSATDLSHSGTVNFQAKVAADPTVGLKDVWVTYTPAGGTQWQSQLLSLSATQPVDPSIRQYECNCALGLTGTVFYMIQAANGVGAVTMNSNNGAFFTVNAATQVAGTTNTSLSVSLPGGNTTAYLDKPVVTVSLQTCDNNSVCTPLSGKQVTLNIGGDRYIVQTGADGKVTLNNGTNLEFRVLQPPPAQMEITASFAGDSTYAPTFITSQFQVTKATTSLTMAGPTSALFGSVTGLAATLTSAGVGLSDRPVIFIANNGTTQYQIPAITDKNGVARLGTAPLPPGNYTITAYFKGTIPGVGSFSDDIFNNAVSNGTSFVISTINVALKSGTSGTQSAPINTPFSQPFQILVTDSQSTPLSGRLVTFSAPVTGAGGIFADPGVANVATVLTDSNGIATAPIFTSNSTPGSYPLDVLVGGIKFPLFTLTNTKNALSVVSGDGQSTVTGTAFALPLKVKALDASSNPVANAAITFTAPATGASGTFPGNLTTVTVNTGSDGIATAPTFTANGISGSYQVTVSGANSTTTFNLTNFVPVLAVTGGDNQSTQVGTAFASPLAVKVTDSSNNPVKNVAVTFTAPNSGASGTFSNNSVSYTINTDASGVATSTVFTANAIDGSYRVTASLANVSVVFNLTNTKATTSNGKSYAWGSNLLGQLGTGSFSSGSKTPVNTVNLTGLVAVSAGAAHSLALDSNGQVWAWGDNTFGQLGDGTTTNRYSPVKVTIPGTVIAISAGGGHSLALTSDGKVWAWGNNTFGQLGDGTTTRRKTPVAVNLTSVTGKVTAISAGAGHSLLLTDKNEVWVWGDNTFGQLGDGTTTNRKLPAKLNLINVTSISAGGGHSLALDNKGQVWAWGENDSGQLGTGTFTDSKVPAKVSLPTNIPLVAVSAGGLHSLGLDSNGQVWAWGNNKTGQLGDGTTTNRKTMVKVSGLASGVKEFSAGLGHSLARKADGTLVAWGNNLTGQLGDGTTTNRLSPVAVAGVTGALAISAGGAHSLSIIP